MQRNVQGRVVVLDRARTRRYDLKGPKWQGWVRCRRYKRCRVRVNRRVGSRLRITVASREETQGNRIYLVRSVVQSNHLARVGDDYSWLNRSASPDQHLAYLARRDSLPPKPDPPPAWSRSNDRATCQISQAVRRQVLQIDICHTRMSACLRTRSSSIASSAPQQSLHDHLTL